MDNDLERFLIAQQTYYQTALQEIKSGKKRSHWMWFIFPQIAGLSHSETARYYAIKNMEEASLYGRLHAWAQSHRNIGGTFWR